MTRGIAVVPAIAVVLVWGEGATGRLLVLSQVVLSLQLPFALVPLLLFTADRRRMGPLRSPPWLTAAATVCTVAIIAGDVLLLVQGSGG